MAEHPDGPDLGDIKAGLGKKIGPLPVGVWLAAIGGGLGIAWYMRRRSAAAAEEETAEPGRSTDTAPGVGGAAGSGGTGGTGTTPPATNEEWYQLAFRLVLGLNKYTATAIDTALKVYLTGSRQLTAAEQAIVSEAIRLAGPPPQPTPVPDPGTTTDPDTDPYVPPVVVDPPVITYPPVTTTTDPRPASIAAGSGEMVYTTVSGDNLYELAEDRVGKPVSGESEPTHTRNYRDAIYDKNYAEIEWQARKHGQTTSNYGQSLYAGTRLVLPATSAYKAPKATTAASSTTKKSSSSSSSKAGAVDATATKSTGKLPSKGGFVDGNEPLNSSGGLVYKNVGGLYGN